MQRVPMTTAGAEALRAAYAGWEAARAARAADAPAAPGQETPEAAFARLFQAVEPRRQALLRALNLCPGGTIALVRMREDLLAATKADPSLAPLDVDFAHLFASWFNRGFLVLREIDWNTPAAILEKIVAYEAVHEIRDWAAGWTRPTGAAAPSSTPPPATSRWSSSRWR